MQRAGLTPGGDQATWEQAFTVPTGIKLGDGNALRILAPPARALTLAREFVPLTMSADGAWEGDVVFAGFGITAPDVTSVALHYATKPIRQELRILPLINQSFVIPAGEAAADPPAPTA